MFFKIFGKSTALLFEMNKENMAEQQENKDWLDKLGEFFSKIFINPNKDIAYSIRKCGNDEIEIRDSIFDGYARGFIRFVLFAGFLIIGFGGGNSLNEPFSSQISDFKMDYTWAFTPDELIIPNYRNYLELYKKKDTLTSKDPFKTYEEYRKPYLREWENDRFKFILYCTWLFVFFYCCAICFFPPPTTWFSCQPQKTGDLLANHLR